MLEGSKPFTSQGEAGTCEFPSYCVSLFWGLGLWQDCVSASPTHLSVGFFLICLMYRSCSASFWISFRRNCSVCSCRLSVSMAGCEFRSLSCCHLELELQNICIVKNLPDSSNLLPGLRFIILNSDLKSWCRRFSIVSITCVLFHRSLFNGLEKGRLILPFTRSLSHGWNILQVGVQVWKWDKWAWGRGAWDK